MELEQTFLVMFYSLEGHFYKANSLSFEENSFKAKSAVINMNLEFDNDKIVAFLFNMCLVFILVPWV